MFASGQFYTAAPATGPIRHDLDEELPLASRSVVEAARGMLGRAGAFMPETPFDPTPADVQRAACRRLEDLGYRSAWTNELLGKDSFAQLSMLLASTERMAFGTCIANIWVRPAQTAYGAAALLSGAYPGRFVLGLGVGYPQQASAVGREFGRPLATMREYLTAMDATAPPDAPPPTYATILGANGPKMLGLAATMTDGALPAGSPPTDTRIRANAWARTSSWSSISTQAMETSDTSPPRFRRTSPQARTT